MKQARTHTHTVPVPLEDGQLPSPPLIQYPFLHHSNGLMYATGDGTNGVRLRADTRADWSTETGFRLIELSDLGKTKDYEHLVVICSGVTFSQNRQVSIAILANTNVNISFHQVFPSTCRKHLVTDHNSTKWTYTSSPVIFLNNLSSSSSQDCHIFFVHR